MLSHKLAGIFPVPLWLWFFVVAIVVFVFKQEIIPVSSVFDTTGNQYGRFLSPLALKCHDPLKQILLTQSQSAALRQQRATRQGVLGKKQTKRQESRQWPDQGEGAPHSQRAAEQWVRNWDKWQKGTESHVARAPWAEDSSAINSPCILEPRTEVSHSVEPRAHGLRQVRVIPASKSWVHQKRPRKAPGEVPDQGVLWKGSRP